MSYKIHHLNAATLCPGSERLFTGQGSWLTSSTWVCHCLLIESDQGLILVDTGFSYRDMTSGGWRERLVMRTLNTVIDPEQCVLAQVERLGFRPEEVRHIVLTHLDADHAGGIKDFPHAQIHLHRQEWQAGMKPITWYEKLRYQRNDWQHEPFWRLHQPVGERWFDFDAVRLLDPALPDILLIPLTGHTRGHSGVAVATEQGWLLHCGDAYLHQIEIKAQQPECPLGVALVHRLDDVCRADRLQNQQRLRELYQSHGDQITLVCSHDPHELKACCVHNRPLSTYRA